MTWTFDYTSVFAIGSLAIILAGAFVFYLGMAFCDGVDVEYSKIGIPKKYDRIKYYKYGALFLSECAKSAIVLLVVLCFIMTIVNNYLKIDITNIVGTRILIATVFVVIIVQFYILSWNLNQLENCDNYIKYSKKLHLRACLKII